VIPARTAPGWPHDAGSPPIYFLLIRPPLRGGLVDMAVLRAAGTDFELYATGRP
jgi:hypothetical protein